MRGRPSGAVRFCNNPACERCDQPTTGRFCAFCRARAQILGERIGEPPGDREIAEAVSEEVMPAELYGSAAR